MKRKRTSDPMNALDRIMMDQGRQTQWLAQKLKLTPQAVSNYRCNKREMRHSLKIACAQILEVDIKELER